jgi:putative acetyltransferase
MNIHIRKEKETDHRLVEELTREAFWNLFVPGCDEHYLVHILRGHPDFIHDLNLVAEHDGQVIGNIMFTRSSVSDGEGNQMDTITFGPVSVLPEFQRKGIGSALISHAIEIAMKNGENAILIYGHPKNYCKHGFRSCRDFQITDPAGRYPFGLLVRELKDGVLDGGKDGKPRKFFPSSVYDVDQEAAKTFDEGFPPKPKESTISQVEFGIAFRAFID